MNNAVALPTYVQEKINKVDLPLKYDVAVKALAACRDINEAKYYHDKSEALAAWAKIYKNDDAKIEAKRLKIHAYRRMGVLAKELAATWKRPPNFRGGSLGAATALTDAGLSRPQAETACAVARATEKQFKKAMSAPLPPTISSFKHRLKGVSGGWKTLSGYTKGGTYNGASMTSFSGFCKKHDPKLLAKSLSTGELRKARDMATDLIEWLDTFEQYLATDAK